jgi:hypothetical protein
VRCGEGEARGAASGVADEVEAVEARGLGGSQDSIDLDVEHGVGRGLIGRVDLELLGHRLDVVTERLQQCPICQVGREHCPGKQDHLWSRTHEISAAIIWGGICAGGARFSLRVLAGALNQVDEVPALDDPRRLGPADSGARIASADAGIDASPTGCLAVVSSKRLRESQPDTHSSHAEETSERAV